MAVQIPYVREIEFEYGDCDEVSPLIRRVVAKNPSAFTYKGTGTYSTHCMRSSSVKPA